MKVAAIIPARYESTRLPGKVLLEIQGKSILQRVYDQVKKVEAIDLVAVATDSEMIAKHCGENGIECIMTSSSHQSGTDRIAEAANSVESDIIINVQGDEPFIEPAAISCLVELMHADKVQIGTLCKKIIDESRVFDYNTVKMVMDKNSKVMYFSRQAIPANRDRPYAEWIDHSPYYQHLGIYGFKKETLLNIARLDMSELEKTEKLEQLRWLENGYTIYGRVVQSDSFGIDTMEDLEKAREIYK